MGEYSFDCWNNGCGDIVERDWEEVEEDVSGVMAYCSKGCFLEDCRNASMRFNKNYRAKEPYIVGDSASEEQFLKNLKKLNPYIAHSIEEEEEDTFSGNWHYIWIPDLEALKEFAQEVAEDGQSISAAMREIDYSEWEEFIMFTHPVKGIALINAWEGLQGRSASSYVV